MEMLDRARSRVANRLPQSILEPVVVNTVNDIKSLVAELDPNRNPAQASLPVAAMLSVPSEGSYRVEAMTKSKSKRDIIIEGMEVIRGFFPFNPLPAFQPVLDLLRKADRFQQQRQVWL